MCTTGVESDVYECLLSLHHFNITCFIIFIFFFRRYCESRRKVLLDHVHEGYDKDLWDYMDVVN